MAQPLGLAVTEGQVHTLAGVEVEQGRGAAQVVPLDQLPGVGVSAEIADQTTTPTQTDFASGLLSVSLAYIDRGSAVGTILYVVFDALDDADASTKLGAAGSREIVMLGERRQFVFSPTSPCYRIDVASDAASETGDTLVAFSGKVQA